MSPQQESDNPYVSELKSLLKDKFFMMLLGISVAIVLISTFYSFIRPKTGQISKAGEAASTVQVTPTVQDLAINEDIKPTDSIKSLYVTDVPTTNSPQELAGLESEETTETKKENLSLWGRLKSMMGNTATATPSSKQSEEADNATSPNDQKNTPPPQSDSSDTLTGTAVEPTPSLQAGAVVMKIKPGTEYVVQAGDTLWDIALKSYGSGYNFVDIASANSLLNPDILNVGAKLKVPQVAVRNPDGQITPQAAMTRSADAVPSTHTVKDGDNLWALAVAYYNNGYEWTKLASFNTLADPNILYPGQVLKLK